MNRALTVAVPVAALGIVAPGCAQRASSAAPALVVHVPARAKTVGDELTAMAPLGADLLVEVDLARLRGNAVVGEAIARLSYLSIADEKLAILRDADAVLFCAYDVGEVHARTLTILRGKGGDDWGTAVAADTYALGPPALVARVTEVQNGAEPALAADRALMAARTRAMPEKAGGASIRLAARLDFSARVALAGQFDLDQVPEEISLWGDVADDLGVVLVASGAEPGENRGLARMMEQWRAKIAQNAWVQSRFLQYVILGTSISTTADEARAVLVVGPKRLQRLVERLLRSLPKAEP